MLVETQPVSRTYATTLTLLLRSLEQLLQDRPGYSQWMVGGDLFVDTNILPEKGTGEGEEEWEDWEEE